MSHILPASPDGPRGTNGEKAASVDELLGRNDPNTPQGDIPRLGSSLTDYWMALAGKQPRQARVLFDIGYGPLGYNFVRRIMGADLIWCLGTRPAASSEPGPTGRTVTRSATKPASLAY